MQISLKNVMSLLKQAYQYVYPTSILSVAETDNFCSSKTCKQNFQQLWGQGARPDKSDGVVIAYADQ
jgi:hypothetical protein